MQKKYSGDDRRGKTGWSFPKVINAGHWLTIATMLRLFFAFLTDLDKRVEANKLVNVRQDRLIADDRALLFRSLDSLQKDVREIRKAVKK